jgi:hypothetical protein
MQFLSRANVLCLILVGVALAAPAQRSSGQTLVAQKSSEQKLLGPEIKTLLENNTAHGIWEDREYFQYFDPKGPTIYREARSGVSLGEWYTSDTQFCSIWSRQVSCYDVLHINQGDGKQYVWVIPNSKQRYTFEVFKGNQIPTGR